MLAVVLLEGIVSSRWGGTQGIEEEGGYSNNQRKEANYRGIEGNYRGIEGNYRGIERNI